MTTRVGWHRSRPDDERPPRVADGPRLFEVVNFDERGRGRHVVAGFVVYRKHHLQELRDAGRLIDLRVVGALRVADDVTADLLDDTVGSARVVGAIFAAPALRRSLRDRSRSERVVAAWAARAAKTELTPEGPKTDRRSGEQEAE